MSSFIFQARGEEDALGSPDKRPNPSPRKMPKNVHVNVIRWYSILLLSLGLIENILHGIYCRYACRPMGSKLPWVQKAMFDVLVRMLYGFNQYARRVLSQYPLM